MIYFLCRIDPTSMSLSLLGYISFCHTFHGRTRVYADSDGTTSCVSPNSLNRSAVCTNG